MKAEWEAAQAPVGEGGRSSCCGARLMSGVKKTLLEDRVFLLAETHPNSICSGFASRPKKPLQRRESRQWERRGTDAICCLG